MELGFKIIHFVSRRTRAFDKLVQKSDGRITADSLPSRQNPGDMKMLTPLLLIGMITLSCKSTKPVTAGPAGLTGTYWKLTELNGRPVAAAAGQKDYYLQLDKESGRVSAFAGCNQMMGSFTSPDAFRVSFSKLASTRMACPDMALETEFAQVLESVDNYAIANNTLSLNKARMAPLARFVAAPQPK